LIVGCDGVPDQLGEHGKGSQPVATGWDSLNANAYATGTDALGAGGWGKAPATRHVEPRAFLNLYNKAHSEIGGG
jgi:hypothetical protein